MYSDHPFVLTGRELVLHNQGQAQKEAEVDDDILEFDLEVEVDHGEPMCLAMAHFYSGKKFNARGMF
jgi:hypothetical protein